MAGLLNVGEMGSLALHVMVELADAKEKDEAARLTAQELAERLRASVHTLQKVIRRLVLGSLLEGARGAHGGVRLAEGAEAAPLLEVLECVEGPIRANGCLFAKRVCPKDAPCRFHLLTEEMEACILGHFTRTTIADLAKNAHGSMK